MAYSVDRYLPDRLPAGSFPTIFAPPDPHLTISSLPLLTGRITSYTPSFPRSMLQLPPTYPNFGPSKSAWAVEVPRRGRTRRNAGRWGSAHLFAISSAKAENGVVRAYLENSLELIWTALLLLSGPGVPYYILNTGPPWTFRGLRA